jgi:hypothetical protein
MPYPQFDFVISKLGKKIIKGKRAELPHLETSSNEPLKLVTIDLICTIPLIIEHLTA